MIPRFLDAFPTYPDILNYYNISKCIYFVNKQKDEAVELTIYPDQFDITVRDLSQAQGEEDYVNTIKLENSLYNAVAGSAVWYNTTKRTTLYTPGDLERQAKLIPESFEVLRDWFNQRAEWRKLHPADVSEG